jgi:hypothetical protein
MARLPALKVPVLSLSPPLVPATPAQSYVSGLVSTMTATRIHRGALPFGCLERADERVVPGDERCKVIRSCRFHSMASGPTVASR